MNHDIGDLLKLETALRNEAGALADPTHLVLKLRAPSGAETEQVWPEGTIARTATGIFFATALMTEAGVWLYEWKATGAVELADPGELVVREDQIDAVDPEPFAVPWRPDTVDVAALIHARTVVAGGERIGDFNDETEPTGDAVERLINLAVRTVASSIGIEPCNANLRADARAAVTYLAAALVEQSYWPEQSISAQSTFAGLMKVGEGSLATLTTRVEANCGGGEGGEIEGGAVAAGHFDDGVEVLGRIEPPRW